MKRQRWIRTCLLQSITVALGVSGWTAPTLRAQTSPPEILIETKLVVSDGMAADQFGAALAVSNDVLVTSAPSAVVDGKKDAGTAYVFLRDPATAAWTEQKKLLPQDGAAFDQFGTVVAVDGETIVIGAPNAAVNGTFQQGAVYIFGRQQGGTDNWGQVAKLTDDTVGFGGHFGSALAIKGDLLVVGASEASTRHGRVTIFERNRGGADAWGAVTTISYTTVGDGNNVVSFGTRVALDGDLLLIGAARTSVSYWNEADGAAYLFLRNAGDADRWDFVTRLITPGADRCVGGLTLTEAISLSAEFLAEAQRCAKEDSQTDNDNFGNAVALTGDVVVVGARFAEGVNGTFSNGAAYVFQRDAAALDRWNFITKLAPADTSAFAFFGSALALADDMIVVGAPGAVIGDKNGQGAAYVFKRDAGGVGSWGEVEKLLASDGLSEGQFGAAVAFDGQAALIGADGADDWRGAIYRQAPATEPPPPPLCTSLVSATDTLQDGTTLTSSTGLVLTAATGTLSAPAPLYIRQVPAPAESIWDGAAAVSSYYEVGVAGCSVSSSPMQPFTMSLPVPEGVPADGLAVAALVPGSALIDTPGTDRSWEPAVGAYDAEHRLYQISLGGLLNEGITFVLVQDPNLAPAPPSETAARTWATATPAPRFWIYNWGVSTDQFNQVVPVLQSTFAEAYSVYQQNGFPLAALTGYENSEQGGGADTPVINVNVRPSNGWQCAGLGGYYNDGLRSISICLNPIMPVPSGLPIVAAHELFHAVQRAYFAWYSAWRLLQSEDWIREGTADLAAGTAVGASAFPSPVHRTDYTRLRRADVSLLAPAGDPPSDAPYGAQDFWEHLLLRSHDVAPRNFTLDELDRFLRSGETTAAIAARLNVPSPTYQPLGEEYWAWVKNQVLEKTVDFDGALQNPCTLELALIGRSPTDGADITWPASDHVFGNLEALQAKLVKIQFTTAVNNVTITAEGGGGVNVLAYKVFRDGEANCADPNKFPDGKREFDAVAQGDLIYVLLADMQYDQQAPAPLFEVRVIPSK